jgi:hypothetical protein
MTKSIESHLTIILHLNTRQHWCVLLPVQLLLSATDLNNSNKQTSPAIRARLLQQLLHTHVTPGNLNLVLQACCAIANLMQDCLLPVALPLLCHMLLCSLCVSLCRPTATLIHATQIYLSSWSPIELPAFLSWHGWLKETAAAAASSARSISPLKQISSMIAHQATATGAFDHSK